MRRRDFVTLLGGAAAAWPLAARAQQIGQMRRIGMLMPLAESDPEAQAFIAAFREELQHVGWTEGRNIRIDVRWGRDPESRQQFAKELVALQPDLILSQSTPNPFMVAHRVEVTSLVARYRLPTISAYRFYTELGALLSYGNDVTDSFRRAANYADRILKGAMPNELPVQAPVKFELVVNLKTANSLGLSVPPTLLARADEVIE